MPSGHLAVSVRVELTGLLVCKYSNAQMQERHPCRRGSTSAPRVTRLTDPESSAHVAHFSESDETAMRRIMSNLWQKSYLKNLQIHGSLSFRQRRQRSYTSPNSARNDMGAKKTIPSVENVYTVAGHWVECALRKDDSLFTPGKPIWSPALLQELRSHFLERPDLEIWPETSILLKPSFS